MKKQYVTLTVNGREYRFSIGDGFGQVPPSGSLSQTLRQRLELTGSKESCSEGACGCCTVLMDGKGVTSCMVLTVECGGKHVVAQQSAETPAESRGLFGCHGWDAPFRRVTRSVCSKIPLPGRYRPPRPGRNGHMR